MKFKILFIFFFGIVLSLMVVNTGFASWPIAIAPTIEGQVLDATTGQPIENAILEITWQTSVYAVVDRSSGRAGYKLIATDKDGRYKIPAKIMLQPLGGFFSSFAGVIIVVRHPLYESKDINYWRRSIGGDRIIKEDVKLLSLEEKYKNIDRTKIVIESKKIPLQITNLSNDLIGNSLGNNYFLLAKKIIISKEYIDYIFRKWDELISEYPDNERDYLRQGIESFRQDIQE